MSHCRTPSRRPCVVDSHCHIDLLELSRVTIDDWADVLSSEGRDFEFGGAIPNFSYPSVYVKPLGEKAPYTFAKKSGAGHNPLLAQLDLGLLSKRVNLLPADWILGAGFSCHPKNADEYNDEVHEFLSKIFRERSAYGFTPIAAGEMGADESNDEVPLRDVQLRALGRQLDLAVEFDLPVILHLRPDWKKPDLVPEVLDVMQQKLAKAHNIHFHCFSLNERIADEWRDSFPNCFFGFTPKILGNRCSQALLNFASKCPVDRVLLETDAPLFRVQNAASGYPGNALDVAIKLAQLRRMSVDDVLLRTEYNTQVAYKLISRS